MKKKLDFILCTLTTKQFNSFFIARRTHLNINIYLNVFEINPTGFLLKLLYLRELNPDP